MSLINPALVRALACLLLTAGTICAQTLTPRTLAWQGVTRTWYEHVPASYKSTAPVALVISLHGSSGRGDSFAPQSEWIPQADAAGFIAVFPNGGVPMGSDFGWNAFVFDGSAPDDAGFLAAMIAQISATYRIDPTRIYMTGFSNGGGMTSTFAGLHASALAAIAPVSGGWLTSFGIPTSAMHPDAPLPVWIWRGALENFPNGSLTLAEQDSQQTRYWADFNGDAAAPRTMAKGVDTDQIYAAGRAEVRFTSIAGADHAYQPGTTARLWNEFFVKRIRGAPVPPVPPSVPAVSIAVEAAEAFEKHLAPGSVLITRQGDDLGSSVTIFYEAKGRAVAGVNYRPLRGVAVIPAGAASVRVKVHPLHDHAADGDRNVKVTLLPGAGYEVGAPAEARIQIIDKD